MDLIDRDALRKAMYHEAFETDSKDQRWDSGCWIRYKMFERNLKAVPTVEAVPIAKLCEWLEEQDYEIYCFMCQEQFDTGGGCPNQVSDSQWRCGDKEHWKAFLKKVMEGWDGDVH